jgi:hypothetical protein
MRAILVMMAVLVSAAVLLVSVVVGVSAAVLFGAAPACAAGPDSGRSVQEMGKVLDEAGLVVISDAEASGLAERYLDGVVEDSRICFSPGAAHLSGKMPMGLVAPSFYASLGVDLSGQAPEVTGLDVQLGALPGLPGVSDLGKRAVNDLINDNLPVGTLDQQYGVEFTEGAVAIKKL